MFNPSDQNSNPESIWELMGTFFALIPQEDRKVFEHYYESLSRANSGLFYSLYQAESLRYLREQDGWYELISQEYSLVKEDSEGLGRENLDKEYINTPTNLSSTQSSGGGTYAYKVTALNSQGETTPSKILKIEDALLDGLNPINLTWDAVEGATEYRVYGRRPGSYKILGEVSGTSFSDFNGAVGNDTPPLSNNAFSGWSYKLKEGLVYLSIPSLESDGVTLQEGANFSIKSRSKLFFPVGTLEPLFRNEFGSIRRTFTAKDTIVLSPVLTSFYLKGLGADKEFFHTLPYRPFLRGYSAANDLDKTLMLGEHYKYLTWGLFHYSKKAPSMYNLKRLYSLVKGYPFAYERGTVLDVTATIITIGDRVYDVSPGSPDVSVGEEVEPFQILSSGVQIRDWISHPSVIEGLSDSSIESRLVLNLDSNYSYPHSTDLLKAFRKNSIPAGVRLIET